MPQIPLLYYASNNIPWIPACLHVTSVFWIEWQRTAVRVDELGSLSSTAARLLTVESIKLFLSLAMMFWRNQHSSEFYAITSQYPPEDEEYMTGTTGDNLVRQPESQAHGNRHNPTDVTLSTPTFRVSIAYIVLTSAVFAYSHYNVGPSDCLFSISIHTVIDQDAIAKQITDPFTMYLTLSFSTLITLFISTIILAQSFAAVQWHATLLQVSRI